MADMAASSRLRFFYVSPILLFLPLLTAPINAQQGSFFSNCIDEKGYYPSNSTYDKNLHTLLASLTSNDNNFTTDGFYHSSFGENPHQVFATGLCRADLKPNECRSCLNDSKSLLIQNCTNHKEAIGWYRTCTLRYSYRSIYGIMELVPAFYSPSLENVSSDVDSFNRQLRALMENLTVQTVSGGSSRNFAAGHVRTTGYLNKVIYGMVQCSPDLTVPDCNDCLYRGLLIFYDYCYGVTSAYSGLPNCNVAYNLTRFYDQSIDNLNQLLAPPPPPLQIPSPSPPVVSTTPTHGTGKNNNTSRTVTIAVVLSAVVFLVFLICIWLYIRKRKVKANSQTCTSCENEEEISSEEFSQFDFERIREATNDFSDANKLGQGGFGAVYRGQLSTGQEIAVKQLIGNSSSSKQGDQEFKNEVLLVSKLGHRNLVNLLGFCLEKNERILVYEFVPNTSLDRFIFDPVKREHMDWDRRYKIIIGIARGLLYLHEESRLKIIHRDLKAGNILLDSEMNPKISDFGTARLFPLDQSIQNTKRIVGTYGYMAPEYVQRGQFSVKSDVFSFGVLVLEIVSGQKVKNFHDGEKVESLLSYAWKIWNEGKAINLADPKMREVSRHEIVRCIHVGLLCVQEKVTHRPTMGSVVLMLSSSSLFLRPPSRPAYFTKSNGESEVADSNHSQISNSIMISENNISISELYPR